MPADPPVTGRVGRVEAGGVLAAGLVTLVDGLALLGEGLGEPYPPDGLGEPYPPGVGLVDAGQDGCPYPVVGQLGEVVG